MINNKDEIKKAAESAVNSGSADNLASALMNSMNDRQKSELNRILGDPSSVKKLLETPEAAEIAELLKNIAGG